LAAFHDIKLTTRPGSIIVDAAQGDGTQDLVEFGEGLGLDTEWFFLATQ